MCRWNVTMCICGLVSHSQEPDKQCEAVKKGEQCSIKPSVLPALLPLELVSTPTFEADRLGHHCPYGDKHAGLNIRQRFNSYRYAFGLFGLLTDAWAEFVDSIAKDIQEHRNVRKTSKLNSNHVATRNILDPETGVSEELTNLRNLFDEHFAEYKVEVSRGTINFFNRASPTAIGVLHARVMCRFKQVWYLVNSVHSMIYTMQSTAADMLKPSPQSSPLNHALARKTDTPESRSLDTTTKAFERGLIKGNEFIPQMALAPYTGPPSPIPLFVPPGQSAPVFVLPGEAPSAAPPLYIPPVPLLATPAQALTTWYPGMVPVPESNVVDTSLHEGPVVTDNEFLAATWEELEDELASLVIH